MSLPHFIYLSAVSTVHYIQCPSSASYSSSHVTPLLPTPPHPLLLCFLLLLTRYSPASCSSSPVTPLLPTPPHPLLPYFLVLLTCYSPASYSSPHPLLPCASLPSSLLPSVSSAQSPLLLTTPHYYFSASYSSTLVSSPASYLFTRYYPADPSSRSEI